MLSAGLRSGLEGAERAESGLDGPAGFFSTAFDLQLPEGRCVGVYLPRGRALTPGALEATRRLLLPEELDYCLGLPEVEKTSFLGGRIAMRAALGSNGSCVGPIVRDVGGGPCLPCEVSGSISHKRGVAVALVQHECDGHIGVDIDEPGKRRRPDLHRRILTSSEQQWLEDANRAPLTTASGQALSRDDEVLLRFSLKEALYKALHPYVQRYIGFKEVETTPKEGGSCQVIRPESSLTAFFSTGFWTYSFFNITVPCSACSFLRDCCYAQVKLLLKDELQEGPFEAEAHW
ncbi:unnamed protein product, partial [Chrysoparadoxa australica]